MTHLLLLNQIPQLLHSMTTISIKEMIPVTHQVTQVFPALTVTIAKRNPRREQRSRTQSQKQQKYTNTIPSSSINYVRQPRTTN